MLLVTNQFVPFNINIAFGNLQVEYTILVPFSLVSSYTSGKHVHFIMVSFQEGGKNNVTSMQSVYISLMMKFYKLM